MVNRRYRALIVGLVIIGLLYAPVFQAHQAEAQIGKFAGAVANCLIGSIINAIIGVGVGLLISAIFLVPTLDPTNISAMIKEYITDPTMRCVVRFVLDETIGSMLEVVRKKGRDGTASYIRNWRNFQTQAQYRGEDVMRGIVANTQICGFLKEGINQQLGVNSRSAFSLAGINLRVNNLNPFTLRSKCPLPDNFDLAAYKEDPMANGGLSAFNQMLSPAGNIIGQSLLTEEELRIQRGLAEQTDLNEGLSAEGFLGTRGSAVAGTVTNPGGKICSSDTDCGTGSTCGALTCKDINGTEAGTCSTSADCSTGYSCSRTCSALVGTPGAEPSCLVRGPNGKCISYADIRSPASYLKETVGGQIQQEMAWLTNVDELNELVVGWIWTRLTNRLQDLGADEEPPTYGQTDSTGSGPATPPGPGPTGTTAPNTCWKDPNCDCSNTAPDTFHGDVIAAIDQVIADDRASQTIFEHSVLGGLRNKPHIRTGQSVAYLNAVLAKLAGRGYTGMSPDNFESIAIVKNGVEQIFDIIQAGGWTWASQGSVCTPPHFN